MKPRLKWIGLIVFALGVFFWLIQAPVIAAYLTQKLGVPITLRTASLSPSAAVLRQFKIGNPPGFNRRPALEAERIQIRYVWKELRSQPAEIESIELENIVLRIEILNRGKAANNWSAIGARIPRAQSGRGVLIHRLILKNLTVEIEGPGAQMLGVEGKRFFDRMEFDAIDSRQGFPTKQLIRQIFQGAGLIQYIENLLNPVEDIKNVLNPFQLFGKQEAPGNMPESLGH